LRARAALLDEEVRRKKQTEQHAEAKAKMHQMQQQAWSFSKKKGDQEKETGGEGDAGTPSRVKPSIFVGSPDQPRDPSHKGYSWRHPYQPPVLPDRPFYGQSPSYKPLPWNSEEEAQAKLGDGDKDEWKHREQVSFCLNAAPASAHDFVVLTCSCFCYR